MKFHNSSELVILFYILSPFSYCPSFCFKPTGRWRAKLLRSNSVSLNEREDLLFAYVKQYANICVAGGVEWCNPEVMNPTQQLTTCRLKLINEAAKR